MYTSHLELRAQALILHSLNSCGSLFKHHKLLKEVSLTGLRDILIYGHNDKSLGLGLILYLFSKITVIGSSLGPGVCLAIACVLGPYNGARYKHHRMKKALNPTRKWLTTPITFMPLLYQWAYLARPVIF